MKKEEMSIVKAVVFMFAESKAPIDECKKYFSLVFKGNLSEMDLFFLGPKGETLKMANKRLKNIVGIDETILHTFIEKAYAVVDMLKSLTNDKLKISEKQKIKHQIVLGEAFLKLMSSKLSDQLIDKNSFINFKEEYKSSYIRAITDIYLSDNRPLAIEKRKDLADKLLGKYPCFNFDRFSFMSIIEEQRCNVM